ncbi:lipoprotein [Mesoplasma lactucae]|uniref:Uncharacterized protein n=1 Tax=Mesoplasma lactucae ATCC 49193 TaxID=81460 RepID=A0A291IS97_9MOLU|nr:lipoprotein [Mesoplasma lactucae]ATG97630.1 hypothetical protein CP520_02705 [Mesoplasma lactucae ATCC 49193]ATZ19909.1 ribose/galactose ABC transporter substrate-binding protein [Mesoplasma lactucae ATCC 49193]MCL8216773.1 hypothetical protein [Mesoplasma lactucae ATCC 49193]
MKKLLTILGSIGIVGISSTSVVSCIAPQYASGVDGQRVVMVTDSGNINDHAFNEAAYDGMSDYLKEEYNLSAKHNYVQPQDGTNTSLVSGYRLAKLKKANALVLPGFTHASTMSQAVKIFNEGESITLIDSSVDYSNPNFNHVISIQFNSQFAGMQAAFDAAYWATTKDKDNKMIGDINNDGHITIGMFGGAQDKYSLDSYLWGALLGIALFNQLYASDKTESVYNLQKRSEILVANSHDKKLENLVYTPGMAANWWVGSFGLNDSIKKGITPNLIDNQKSDIVFPVAGPQIEDVLNYSPKADGAARPYVIGVDVNQSKLYANHRDRFVTGAIKNITSATEQALKHSYSIKDEVNNELISRNLEDCWDGTMPRQFYNWSTGMVDSKNSNDEWENDYKVKEHKFKLYDGQDDPNDPWGDKPVKENDPKAKQTYMMNDVVDKYEALGAVQNYMNGKTIMKFADDLINKFGVERFIFNVQDISK